MGKILSRLRRRHNYLLPEQLYPLSRVAAPLCTENNHFTRHCTTKIGPHAQLSLSKDLDRNKFWHEAQWAARPLQQTRIATLLR